MCGIVGVIYTERDRAVDRGVVQAMCDAIRHRGPDDEGFYVSGRVGVAMRRLSIIDVAGGRQPVFNEDASKLIVFNGEIYNYRELKRDLVQRGHRFRSNGDTETILHLYEELGPQCVEQLRGMFAFAIWDETAHRLLLARDRFGMKPLYVVTGKWGIAFASELKALHAVGLTKDLDWGALDAYFKLGYIPAPSTPFKNICKLEPGHTLVWQDGHATSQRYWDLPQSEAGQPHAVESAVLEWLDDSVRAHLVSDVPVAAFLSGGLDSSAVVSSMAVAGAAPPHAFTARYHGSGAEDADETPLARSLTDRYGARLSVIDVEPDVTSLLEPIVWALDEPHADESAIPSWLISRHVAEQYKVALSGTGGDELFAGYRRHIGLLLNEWYRHVPRPARRLGSALANMIPEPKGGGLAVHRLKRFLRSGDGQLPSRYYALLNRYPEDLGSSLYSPDLALSGSQDLALRRLEAHHEAGGGKRGLRAALYLDYKTYLTDDLLHLADRISMAHSLEVRTPLVDHVLVDHAFPLPDRARIGLMRNKRLLRRALKPRLPAEHFTAPKRGFVGPTATWLRNELRDMLMDELSGDRLGRLGYFDQGVVHTLLDQHLTHRQNREGVLWALLVFSTWHRLYVESGAPSKAALVHG